MARLCAALAGMVVGAAAASRLSPWTWAAMCAAGVAATGVRRRPEAVLTGLVVLSAGAGGLSASARDPGATALAMLAPRVPVCDIGGMVLEHAGALGALVRVDVAACDGARPLRRAGMVAMDLPAAEPGAHIRARGWLVPLDDRGYERARLRLGASAALKGPAAVVGEPRGLYAAAARVRTGLRAASRSSGRPGELLRGLVVGDTSGLDAATRESLRRAGLSHLVAVSGSNLAIVLGAVFLATRRLWLRVRLALGAAAIAGFVLVAGPEPSVLRAAAMGSVGLWALAAGRRARPLYALPVALLALIALRPGLVSSPGLHLSSAATAGIVLWARPLTARMPLLPRPIAATLGATLAAEAAVAPILIATFGELSVTAPVANLLAVPAVVPATVAGVGAAVLGAVAPWAAEAAAAPAIPLCAWVLLVGDRLGASPWASVEVSPWVAWPAGLVAAAAAVRAAGRAA